MRMLVAPSIFGPRRTAHGGAQPGRLASTPGHCRLETSHAVAWSSVAGGENQPPPEADGYSGGQLTTGGVGGGGGPW